MFTGTYSIIHKQLENAVTTFEQCNITGFYRPKYNLMFVEKQGAYNN